MAGSYLNFPYDEEIFNYYWSEATDPVRDALLSSGALVSDPVLAGLAATGSNIYTMPYYDLLGGDEDNYDGQTNITTTEVSGSDVTGVIYGRAHGFKVTDFVKDFNSGADPLMYAATHVGNWYNHKREKRILGILGAVAQDATFAKTHVVSTGAAIDETTLGDAAVQAMGDHADKVTLAVMHSHVANKLAKLQLLEYAKYTGPDGIERQVRSIGYINGMTVIVDDQAPCTEAKGETAATYTTYLLGQGFLRHAPAKLDAPASEMWRDPATNGGESVIYTRMRETIMPYGFSFKKPSGMTASPTDAQLFAKANWELKYDPKTVPFVAVTTQV